MTLQIVAAQAIKQRGIGIVDEMVKEGRAVHVVARSVPRYVILSEERYAELMDELNEAAVIQAKIALDEYHAGLGTRYENAEAYLAAVNARGDE
jgi:PHD/YefM family antitoxin component YafN of YafNO toxin-antitoxin module